MLHSLVIGILLASLGHLTVLPDISMHSVDPLKISDEVSLGTLIVFGATSHYIQRYPHLPTKHELERGVEE